MSPLRKDARLPVHYVPYLHGRSGAVVECRGCYLVLSGAKRRGPPRHGQFPEWAPRPDRPKGYLSLPPVASIFPVRGKGHGREGSGSRPPCARSRFPTPSPLGKGWYAHLRQGQPPASLPPHCSVRWPGNALRARRRGRCAGRGRCPRSGAPHARTSPPALSPPAPRSQPPSFHRRKKPAGHDLLWQPSQRRFPTLPPGSRDPSPAARPEACRLAKRPGVPSWRVASSGPSTGYPPQRGCSFSSSSGTPEPPVRRERQDVSTAC
jgi:ribosomal protein L34E